MENRMIKGMIVSSIVFLFMFFSIPFISHDKEKKITLPKIKVRFFKSISNIIEILKITYVKVETVIIQIGRGTIKCQQVKDYI